MISATQRSVVRADTPARADRRRVERTREGSCRTAAETMSARVAPTRRPRSELLSDGAAEAHGGIADPEEG